MTTNEYEGKFAHLKGYDEKEESNIFPFELVGCSLNKTDLKALKKEILEGPVSKLLKKIVKNLDI